MKPTDIKQILEDILHEIILNPISYVCDPQKNFSRTRKLPFYKVIKMLIGMGGNSLGKELLDWFGYSEETVSVSAFVQQRNKIKPDTLRYIFQKMISQCDKHTSYNGYRLLAIDGSDLRLPSDKRESFSYIQNDETTKGYNLLHLDALYDVLQHVYVDASIQSKIGMNEHKALVSMIDDSAISDKVILIADRGYESFNNIAHCQEKKWNYIIRSKESYGIKFDVPPSETFDIDQLITLTRRQTKQTKGLIKKDPNRYRWIQPHTTFDYLKPKEDKLYDLPIRIVRFEIADSVYETLYTNLPREDFPVDVLKELYRLRWGIETAFRELKYNVGLASIHSRKTAFVFQEIYAKLIMYNFSALIAYSQTVPAGKRINFAKSIHVCYQFFKEQLDDIVLEKLINKYLSPIRPGRSFERNKNNKNAVSFTYRI